MEIFTYCQIELNLTFFMHHIDYHSSWQKNEWSDSWGLDYSVILINIEYIDGLWDHDLEIGHSSQLDPNGKEFFFYLLYISFCPKAISKKKD